MKENAIKRYPCYCLSCERTEARLPQATAVLNAGDGMLRASQDHCAGAAVLPVPDAICCTIGDRMAPVWMHPMSSAGRELQVCCNCSQAHYRFTRCSVTLVSNR